MIVKSEAYFYSTDGESRLRALIWKDNEREPVGVFQIAHGLTDHIDRYERFAGFLAGNGFVVCGNDHIGHGKAAAEMGRIGDFGRPDTDVRMVDDMHKLYNIMSKRYPGLPYILFGHSMGSFLARIYAANFGYELSGLILCGTTQVNSKLSVLQEYVLPFGEMIDPDKYSTTGADLLGKLTAKYYYKEDDENAWLTISKENREEADADPYFGVPITNASSMIVAKLLFKCCSEECILSIPFELPVLLVSGAKDPIGFFGRGVISLCDKLEENGVNTQIQLYPGLRHEILNEDDYEYIYEDILSWTYKTLQGDLQ